jgi:hypothetical protein
MSSSSNGKKWSTPVEISSTPGDCMDSTQTVRGGVVVEDDKKKFVVWSRDNKIYLDRSFDNGGMWLSSDVLIGEQFIPATSKTSATCSNGVPLLIIDKSKKHRGLLYMVWADQKSGSDNTDVWFVRSSNFGDNWTSPSRVNDEKGGGMQYHPSFSVDPTTGFIYVLYYNRNADSNSTDVYLAYSIDAGSKFKNIKVSNSSFEADADFNSLDPLSISAQKGVIACIWTKMEGGKKSISSSVFRYDQLPK